MKDKNEYIQYSKDKEKSQDNYLQHLELFNNQTGEINQLSYSVKKDYENNYKWIVQKSIDIENEAVQQGFDSCLFLTITLDTQFHQFKQDPTTKKIIKNNKYNPLNTIYSGYKLLSFTFRSITNQINRTCGKYKNLNIRVIEPHKTLTPHLHSIIYHNKENTEKITNIIKNKIGLKSYQGNKMIGSNGIGLCDLQLLKDNKRGATYLIKYLNKNFKNGNNEHSYFIDGWKKYNKIRILTYSKINESVPKKIFLKCLPYIPKNIKNTQNCLTWLKDNVDIKYYKKDKTTKLNYIRTDKIRNDNNPKFKIIVKKERDKKNIVKYKKEYTKFLKIYYINDFIYDLYKNTRNSYYDIDIIKDFLYKNKIDISDFYEKYNKRYKTTQYIKSKNELKNDRFHNYYKISVDKVLQNPFLIFNYTGAGKELKELLNKNYQDKEKSQKNTITRLLKSVDLTFFKAIDNTELKEILKEFRIKNKVVQDQYNYHKLRILRKIINYVIDNKIFVKQKDYWKTTNIKIFENINNSYKLISNTDNLEIIYNFECEM